MDGSTLRKWLKAGFLDSSILYPTEEGTPQGGIISPVLANMALDGLQRTLRERFPMSSKGAVARQVHFVRYADDFIVTADSKEVLEEEVRPLLERFLEERGLELSPTKTVITHIEDGFDFLGQTVRKYNGKYISKPSREAVSALLQEARRVIKGHAGTAGELVGRLNPLIRGWANYHRHAASSATFKHVDFAIWKALWRWTTRRHPNKGRRWVARRYFRARANCSWVFTGQQTDRDGRKREAWLFHASAVSIQRHVLIKGAANPFDPQWTAYFQDRRDRKRKKAKPQPTPPGSLHDKHESNASAPRSHGRTNRGPALETGR
jgi:RNA-directed DNA polymerase